MSKSNIKVWMSNPELQILLHQTAPFPVNVNSILLVTRPKTLVVVAQSLSQVQLFVTPWTDCRRQASLSFTISWSLLKLVSTEWIMPPNHFILCCLLLLPSIFPSFRVFQFFALGGQSIEASASVLLRNIQGWFPLGLTGLHYLLPKGLSRVFSRTTIWKHQFLSDQPSLWFNFHIHKSLGVNIYFYFSFRFQI